MDRIKKIYGEPFAQFCRSSCAEVFQIPGAMEDILTHTFFPTKLFLEDDKQKDSIIQIIMAVYEQKWGKKKNDSPVATETPEQLLRKAGYTLYYCKTYEDTLRFTPYYDPKELLCTFYDQNRVYAHYVFFAVKDGAEHMLRALHPDREDDYSHSVLSIQFKRGYYNKLYIISRYNHTVTLPNATYGNELNQIIPGLEQSFKHAYGLNLDPTFLGEIRIPGLHFASNETMFYPYNMSLVLGDDKLFRFGPNNIYIESGADTTNETVTQFDQNRYILVNNILIDKQTKTIKALPPDLVPDYIENIYNNKISKIEVTKQKDGNRLITITDLDGNKSYIIIDEKNQMIGYKNEHITEIGDYFLQNIKTLKYISLPNVETIGNYFLVHNECLESIDFPKLQKVGDYFIYANQTINKVNLPSLKEVGKHCMGRNEALREASFPSLEFADVGFMRSNRQMRDYVKNLLDSRNK